jgi:hypothetical protein
LPVVFLHKFFRSNNMKTIFDPTARTELTGRIHTLSNSNTARWGKMNLYQMLKHCTMWDEWVQGTNKPIYKRELLGYLFGPMALRSMIKNDKPLDKNVPTSAAFKIKETNGDIEAEKKKWIALIEAYKNYSNPGFIHDFFGKMTKEQTGILAYKHTDHHLRQFGG